MEINGEDCKHPRQVYFGDRKDGVTSMNKDRPDF